jgi:hypothetical protein
MHEENQRTPEAKQVPRTARKGDDVAMCDLTVEVLVDDAVEFVFSQLEKKDDECRTQAADADDYDRLFKKWLSETLCDLAGKCEDMGYYRGGGRQGIVPNSEIEGDLRQLASWVDSVLSGNSPHVEEGSSIYTILQRWR